MTWGLVSPAGKSITINAPRVYFGVAAAPSNLTPCAYNEGQIGVTDMYWNKMYSYYYYYKSAPAAWQGHDDIEVIRAMEEDPQNPGHIDKKTIHPLLLENLNKVKQERRAEILKLAQIKREEILNWVDNRPIHIQILNPVNKDDLLAEIEEQQVREIANIDATEDPAIDINSMIGLSLGAIKQLADKLDTMEDRIKVLKK